MYLQKCIKMQICTGYYSADFALLFVNSTYSIQLKCNFTHVHTL
jgi:hypothetical protein